MESGWTNTADYFQRMYRNAQRPETIRFVKKVSSALNNTTTKMVRGDGHCLIGSINEAVGNPILNPKEQKQLILRHESIEPLISAGVLDGNDLDADVNNLDINWCVVFAHLIGRPIHVFIHKDNNYYTQEFPVDVGGADPILLLLHNGHFWPLRTKTISDMKGLWQSGTFVSFAN